MARKGEFIPKYDLKGKRYGKLTVIEYAGYKEGKTGHIYHQWKCQCDCGNIKISTTYGLQSGHCKSCGCMSHKPKNPWKKHGMSGTKLHNVWKAMKGRCYTKTDTAYEHYGLRGITVCDEWKNDFMKFYEWAIAHGYKETEGHNKEYTLDRIDPYGNYEPSNCRITTMRNQTTTKTDMVYREVDGILYNTHDLADKYNIPYSTLKGRLDSGDSIEEALFRDHSGIKIYLEYNGEKHTISEWSKITGIKKVTLYRRYYSGMSTQEIFEKPLRKSSRKY